VATTQKTSSPCTPMSKLSMGGSRSKAAARMIPPTPCASATSPKRPRGGLGVGLDLRVQAPIEERRTDEFRQEQDHLRITYDLWPDDLTRRSPTHRRASIHPSA
jgi:hypothetical protein